MEINLIANDNCWHNASKHSNSNGGTGTVNESSRRVKPWQIEANPYGATRTSGETIVPATHPITATKRLDPIELDAINTTTESMAMTTELAMDAPQWNGQSIRQ